MAQNRFASSKVPAGSISLNGGLNSTSGPLGLADNESSDLQNIDFDKFGSILKRNGYTVLNTTSLGVGVQSDGLYWAEYNDSGTPSQKAVNVANGKIYKMDDLDGTWDDVTGVTINITSLNFCDFETFLNVVLVTNGYDKPFYYEPTTNATAIMTVPTGLTKAKYVKQFQNYTILANCLVSGISHPNRVYWSTIKTIDTWDAADFIEISKDDGQEITAVKVLGQSLVIYRNKSIYLMLFTGDRDIPFVVQKSNANVGCIYAASLQEIENGHKFLSYDGIYYFDGNNAYKTSDKINETILGLNRARFANTVSMYQPDKNRYWLGVTASGSSTNDRVITWDSVNQAFSIYRGINASAMCIFTVDGMIDRPYFADYSGYVYRADVGTNDYPSNVTTAISAYYATNWKPFDDIVDQKGMPHIYLYHKFNNTTLTFIWTYDFDEGDTNSQTVDLSTSTAVYGTGVYGTATYASSGGNVQRRDIDGQGRVVRFKFSNNIISEPFQIDGIGIQVGLETDS